MQTGAGTNAPHAYLHVCLMLLFCVLRFFFLRRYHIHIVCTIVVLSFHSCRLSLRLVLSSAICLLVLAQSWTACFFGGRLLHRLQHHSRGASQVQRNALHAHIWHTSHTTHRHNTQHTNRTLHTHTQRWHMYVYSLRLCDRFRNNSLYLTVQQSTHACHTRLGSPLPFAHNSTPPSCRFFQECFRFPTGNLHD